MVECSQVPRGAVAVLMRRAAVPFAGSPALLDLTVLCRSRLGSISNPRLNTSRRNMAKAKAAAAAGAATKAASNDAATLKRSRAAMASSTRMLVFALLGALATVMSGAFYSSFADGFNSLLRMVAGAAPRELEAGRYDVACADEYPSIGRCSPPPACARVIVDDFLSAKEVAVLKQMVSKSSASATGTANAVAALVRLSSLSLLCVCVRADLLSTVRAGHVVRPGFRRSDDL